MDTAVSECTPGVKPLDSRNRLFIWHSSSVRRPRLSASGEVKARARVRQWERERLLLLRQLLCNESTCCTQVTLQFKLVEHSYSHLITLPCYLFHGRCVYLMLIYFSFYFLILSFLPRPRSQFTNDS